MESNNKLKDDSFIVYNLSALEKLPDIIEIESKLPTVFNVHSMIAAIKRWHELSVAFNKPIRIYAACGNREVEKCMQRLIIEYDNLFLTILPKRKE